jgi:hypothetical protein
MMPESLVDQDLITPLLWVSDSLDLTEDVEDLAEASLLELLILLSLFSATSMIFIY